jgi:hypothetical protein
MGEPGAVSEFRQITYAVSSALLQVECLRTIDRMRLRGILSDEEVARRRAAVYDAVRRIELVPLGPMVLDRASQPFPTTLGTLTPSISARPFSGGRAMAGS